MLLIETQEQISAFNAADRVVGHDRDRLPKIHIEGIREISTNWDVLKKQYRKRKPDPQKVNCLFVGESSRFEKDTVLYRTESGIRVVKEENRKSFVPLLLPPPDFVEEDGRKTGIVPQDAIAAVISAVPKGKVVTKSRVTDFLIIIYSAYMGTIPYDTETNWEGYARYSNEINEYGYGLHPHRLVSDQGEINGNGMSWRYRGSTRSRRYDADILRHEGVPTFEDNYRCYVDDLEKWEYDFDDLFVAVDKKRSDEYD